MGNKVNERNNRYGKLRVLREVPRTRTAQGRHIIWLCLCACGNHKEVPGASLRNGNVISCGCIRRQKASKRVSVSNKKHGVSQHPLYDTWRSMVSRCHNKNDSSYKYYGKRGVQVFSKWRSNVKFFISWIEENLGSKPDGFSLDRIDNDGNYEPDNLRWACLRQQALNKGIITLEDLELLKLVKAKMVAQNEPNQRTFIEGEEPT